MTQTGSSTPVPPAARTSLLLATLAALFIGCLFLFFTWRGFLVYYTGDDVMNLYGYWSKPLADLVKANVFFWTPFYRPFGGVVYRVVFAIFGFNPYPLYAVYFAAMLLNLWLAYLVLSRISGSREIGGIATLLFAFHGRLDYLYYNAGSMYDVFCFLFSFLALAIYLRARTKDRYLGIWGTLGFVACFVCALNSKEMAAALPVIIFVYEIIFHPPNFRSLPAIFRWCFREGRTALMGAVCVLLYFPAKVSSQGLASTAAYTPAYTWARWLEDTSTYLGYLLYRNNPATALNVTPLTPVAVAVVFATLIAAAIWTRSRTAWFGLVFFITGLLPVSFIPARLGFVLYLPLAGLALFAAVCLVRFKERLWRLVAEDLGAGPSPSGASAPLSASVALFVATALVISVIDYRYWSPAPDVQYSPYKNTIREFARLYPTLPPGSKLLFVHSAMDYNWDMVFLLRLFYHDSGLFMTLLNGPPEQRIAVDRLPHYDHVFDYQRGHYVELDNADPVQSIQFHLVKASNPSEKFGEMMTIGKPGASQYIVKDVLAGDPKADGYWTLDNPELQFRLSSADHHFFSEHFFLPLETLKQTGPLKVDFYVNGHLLDKTEFSKDGEVVYRHDVPIEWLKGATITTVRMQIHNPYIAPRDGARLGVLLRSALFTGPQ